MKKPYSSSLISYTLFALALTFNYLQAQNVNIPDANFKAALVGNSSVNTNLDTEIQVTEAAAYNGGLFLGTQGISDLTGIEAFTALTILDVSQNALSTINLTSNTALTTLYCYFNSISCLDLSLNPNLTTLDCSSNSLVDLNVKNGNNAILTSYNSTGNSMLYCIQVDNVALSVTNWTSVDGWSAFNSSCGLPAVCSFTHDAPVCSGTPVTFNNSTMYANTYMWDFGDGTTSILTNPTHTYSGPGSYTVTLIGVSCNDRDTVFQVVDQGKDVYGQVTYSGGNVTNGTAILQPYLGYNISFDTIQTSNLDALGNYYFPNVCDGNYLIKVFVDTLAYPTLCPTFYTNQWAWDSASVIAQPCNSNTVADISMVEMSGGGGGVGLLHGWVVEGLGFGRAPGDPINGVDVKLGVTSTQQIVASTQTDLFGNYTFGNVPFGNYTIYVDIPGLLRDSVYDIVVDASNTQFLDLNYLVDSATIYVLPNIGIEDQHLNDFQFNIFPNPVRGNATLQYIIKNQGKVSIDIYNVVGIKVQTLINTEQESGEYQLTYNPSNASLKPGIYFISLSVNGKTNTKRIIVIE